MEFRYAKLYRSVMLGRFEKKMFLIFRCLIMQIELFGYLFSIMIYWKIFCGVIGKTRFFLFFMGLIFNLRSEFETIFIWVG